MNKKEGLYEHKTSINVWPVPYLSAFLGRWVKNNGTEFIFLNNREGLKVAVIVKLIWAKFKSIAQQIQAGCANLTVPKEKLLKWAMAGICCTLREDRLMKYVDWLQSNVWLSGHRVKPGILNLYYRWNLLPSLDGKIGEKPVTNCRLDYDGYCGRCRLKFSALILNEANPTCRKTGESFRLKMNQRGVVARFCWLDQGWVLWCDINSKTI